jgi:hypothetical protein
MKVFALISMMFAVVSCGSKEDIKTIADALRDDSDPEKSAEKGEVSISENNAKLQGQVMGQWEMYSKDCDAEKISFDFSADGSCYMYQDYGPRYKCSWSWLGESNMKFCVGTQCKTAMKLSYDESKNLLTIKTDKCLTEYKRPKL